MFLIVKTHKSTNNAGHSVTTQTITAAASNDALEEYILNRGLEGCEVYESYKLTFDVSWARKEVK